MNKIFALIIIQIALVRCFIWFFKHISLETGTKCIENNKNPEAFNIQAIWKIHSKIDIRADIKAFSVYPRRLNELVSESADYP